jgi:hypothetical protein
VVTLVELANALGVSHVDIVAPDHEFASERAGSLAGKRKR